MIFCGIILAMKELLPLIWNNLLYYPLINLLIFFYKTTFGNLGLAIIALTLVTRFILLPLTWPSLKMAFKQKELKPELDKLKEKYKDDKQKLAAEQMALMKKNGLNPMAGCLPQVAQVVVLIALYQAFMQVLNVGLNGMTTLNGFLYLPFLHFGPQEILHTQFLYLDLTKSDPYMLLPGLAGASQFWLSKMMMPVISKEEKLAKKAADKPDDMMYNMQQQMLFLAPLMTVLFGWKLPSGLVLYWFLTTLFSLGQQWVFERAQKGGFKHLWLTIKKRNI